MLISSKYKSYSCILILFTFLVPTIAFAQSQELWKGAYTTPEFANGAIRDVYCDLVGEVEGSYGALTFVVGGIMAFGYAVFGDSKKVLSIIMVGVIGATMSTGISLYFGKMCGDTNGGNQTARTAKNYSYAESTDSDQVDASKFDLDQDEGLF